MIIHLNDESGEISPMKQDLGRTEGLSQQHPEKKGENIRKFTTTGKFTNTPKSSQLQKLMRINTK